MDEIKLKKELESIRREMNRMGIQLGEVHSMVRNILPKARAPLEPLSASFLGGLNTDSNSRVTMLSTLPEWATKTFVAVKELATKNIPATAAKVAAMTKKGRNTESSRLVKLAHLGLLWRRRKGRYVLYMPNS